MNATDYRDIAIAHGKRIDELEAELDRAKEQLRLTNIDQANAEAERDRLKEALEYEAETYEWAAPQFIEKALQSWAKESAQRVRKVLKGVG